MRPVDNEGMIVPGLSLQPKSWRLITVPILVSLAACSGGNVQRASTVTAVQPPVLAPVATGLLANAAALPPAETSEATGPSMSDAEIAAAGKSESPASVPSSRPRPFGFLFKKVPGEVPSADAAPQPEIQIALADTDEIPEVVQPVARRGWLFSGRNRAADLPSTAGGVTASAVVGGLPFGQVVTICGVSKRALGTEVARSQGAGSYRLYDSDPSSTQVRPQFLTGFSDNCARQFNASLALFGSAGVHEATRYNPLNTNPYSATDKAYESVKTRLCGVRAGKECPEKRVDRLERKAAFVSVYKGFGNSGEWLEMFLHDGEVAAYQSRAN